MTVILDVTAGRRTGSVGTSSRPYVAAAAVLRLVRNHLVQFNSLLCVSLCR